MCGIAGALSLGRPLGPEDRADVERMGGALVHRGPDGGGLDGDDSCFLANTRLSVTDTGPLAALPMRGRGGAVLLAFNGAVTNFRELRRDLERDGPPFLTGSDAEVLLRLYEDEGMGFLPKLSGMFAFCLYDARAGKVWLARDPFGQRPLFTRVKAGRLHFASEIKSFLELRDFDKRLDAEGLSHFLSLAYIPGASTPFAEVRELGPGRLLEVDLRRERVGERAFFRPDYSPDPTISRAEAAAEVRRLLEGSVRRCLDLDVPVGLSLSGGVDTGILLGILKKLGRSRSTHTFSLRVGDASFDETPFQRTLVEFAQPIHHEVSVSPEAVLEGLKSHMAYLDEPSGDGAAIPMFLLARQAAEHVKVLLSGEGGDEVFLAYETYRAYNARRAYRRALPAPLRRLVREACRRLPVSHDKLSFDFLAKRFSEGAELPVPEAHFFWRHALAEADKTRLMPASAAFPPTSTLFSDLFGRLGFEDESRLAWMDIELYLVGDLMVKNDRMLMAHSLEGRFPYLDKDLFAYAARLPTGHKLRGLQGRLVQKEAARGLVPDSILARSNMGLELPHSRWFQGGLKALAEHHFRRDAVARTGLLDPDAVRALWDEHQSGRRDNGRSLWCVLNLLLWHELFIERGDYKRYWRSSPSPARWTRAAVPT
ncbi:MAG: asparagine synthase (glutamine-hydrolyzing) [Elusimicrobia bacterium]|nr:asparagine synthase (glutamine-hydrolyzing) [Elusimicrobiota bacterium]